MPKQIGWSNESNLLYQISQQITRLINVTGTNGGGSITGSGTTNYIPKWTSSSSLNNSVIYQSSTGNIGIGTTTPSQKLDVNGNVTATYVIAVNEFYGSSIRVNGFYANTIAYMPFYSNISPYGEIMRVNNNGSLWINRTTDDGSGAKLQVNGNISTPNNISSFLNATTFTLSNTYMGYAGGNIQFAKSDYGTRTMTIFDSTGNVLIGSGTSEINTGYKLQVDGGFISRLGGPSFAVLNYIGSATLYGGYGDFITNTDNYFVRADGLNVVHKIPSTNGFMLFNTSTGTAMKLLDSGTFLINRTTDDGTGSTLQVNGGISQAGANNYNYFASKVLIGTTTPSAGLMTVAGDIYPSANNTYELGKTNNLWLAINTSNYVNYGSTNSNYFASEGHKFNVDFVSPVLTITSNKNVLIGTTANNGRKLVVAGQQEWITTVGTGVHTTSGNHLPIWVNGVQYWLALLNPVV